MRAIKRACAFVIKSRTQIWIISIQCKCEPLFSSCLWIACEWVCLWKYGFSWTGNKKRELVGWQCYCLNWWCQWQNKYSNTYKKYLETGIIYSFVQIIDLTLLFFDINKLTRVQMNESVMVHPILLIGSSFLIWYPE